MSASTTVEFSIRCHPSVPLEATDLEEWLEARVRDLRSAWPTGTIRLFRLSQPLPSDNVDLGWLLEAALPADEDDLAPWLAETLRDMRLLGFQPVMTCASDSAQMGIPANWRPPPERRQWSYERKRRLVLSASGSRRYGNECIAAGGASCRAT